MARLIAIMLGTLLAISPMLNAGEFRCDTEIFVGHEKKPVQESLTIFAESVVYDFLLTKPEEITVYDLPHGRITLLDKSRKSRTTIAVDDLLRFTAAYKTAKPESELFAFCVQPNYEESEVEARIVLQSKPITYRVATAKPKQSGAEKRYREFADWSARLNAMRPGNLPPFARMEVNQVLAAHAALPEEVERTITTVHLTGRKHEVIRSRHNYNWTLSAQDHQKIEAVGNYLSEYSLVSVEDYLQLEKTSPKTAAN